MNQTKQSPKSPVIRPGQVWNQSSSSTSNSNSNSNSGSLYGSRSKNTIQQPKKHSTSIIGLIVRILTCRGDINDDREDHVQSAAVQYSTRSSLRSSGKLNHSGQQHNTDELSFQDICKATGNFSASNIIGEGGFGTVYKGTLKNGSIVAIKRAKKDNFDKGTPVEFKNEIRTLSKIEHLNLVRFYGFVEHGDEHIILVEYVANGTLREHLDGKRGNGLEIGERLDIIIDVAHAVTYLHTYTDVPIIHRDIKSSNILITDKLRAKVADFGFARISIEDPEATHISTQVKGTAGYLDPEYLSTYQLTDRSDVYSFGVLLVELVTGRLPIELNKVPSEKITIKWAMQRLKGGEVVLAMDPKLKRNPASLMVVEKVLRVARQCLAPTRQSRPSMKKCAEILWRIRKDYHEHNEVAAAANHSVQVPQMDARKNRHEFFGIEDSSNQRFRSA
ncbi:calmodulin-binding receptor-like cytoplasmic kinase 2 [Rutidosis leptorrhynchoides]|uniref:calmodulin-binding receptor-like cytoplasmic kinase 2 n=1 Tax=Rutidosis leptorrhynchoides TaxID=125765 RepID=UPI003A9969B6